MPILKVSHEFLADFDILEHAFPSVDRGASGPREEEWLDERCICDGRVRCALRSKKPAVTWRLVLL